MRLKRPNPPLACCLLQSHGQCLVPWSIHPPADIDSNSLLLHSRALKTAMMRQEALI
jgi:hypothetical protein